MLRNPFSAKKSLGQNFLTNPKIAEDIAGAAHINRDETVFEIGPGTGVLTRALLAHGARVIALEADKRAVDTLTETFEKEISNGTLTLHHGDIRKTSLAELGLRDGEFATVANIPYYLSGMLFKTLLAGEIQPHTLVFLVQKEVAQRIARSEKESILSLSIKAFGTPRYVQTVKRGNFNPVPGVDSAVLAVHDISRARFATLPVDDFFTILKTGFRSRRKQLFGNLKHTFDEVHLKDAFVACEIPPTARGEDLPIDTWLCLAQQLKNSA